MLCPKEIKCSQLLNSKRTGEKLANPYSQPLSLHCEAKDDGHTPSDTAPFDGHERGASKTKRIQNEFFNFLNKTHKQYGNKSKRKTDHAVRREIRRHLPIRHADTALQHPVERQSDPRGGYPVRYAAGNH